MVIKYYLTLKNNSNLIKYNTTVGNPLKRLNPVSFLPNGRSPPALIEDPCQQKALTFIGRIGFGEYYSMTTLGIIFGPSRPPGMIPHLG